MHKKVLPMSPKNDAAYLEQASSWARRLTQLKSRGPGDTGNAMRSIEREYGVNYGILWSLRYRRERLKTISVSVFEGLRAAYVAECRRQIRKIQDDITRTEAVLGGARSSVLDEAKALVRATES